MDAKSNMKLDGGEAIVEALRRQGVEYVVTSPGSEWSPVWEALSRQKLAGLAGPQFVQCWHETLAVNIAMGLSFKTGRMQAVLLHASVGILQGAMGLYSAARAETPLLVMSGESVTLGEDPEQPAETQWYAGVSSGGANRYTETLTKWSARVHSAATLYQSVLRAGEISRRTPRGPVHLDIPLEYMLQQWTLPEEMSAVPAVPKRVPLQSDIAKVASQFTRAENPVILVEQAGGDSAAFDALREFAEAFAFPVVGAPGNSFANFPTQHPLWLGCGSYQHLEAADLVLLVGGRTPFSPPSRRRTRGRIVALNDHPIKDWLIYQNLQADEYLEGDIAPTLQLLQDAIGKQKPSTKAVDARRSKWEAAHNAFLADVEREKNADRQSDTLSVASICAVLEDLLPADTIFVDETITHALPLRRHLTIQQGGTFFRAALGGLGQGLGLCLGLKIAAPDQPVVLIVGDGSLLYNPIVQAFGASERYETPILIIVLNNGGYGSMKAGHKLFYPDGAGHAMGYEYGVKIDKPHFAEIASSFGFYASRSSSVTEFKQALPAALEALANKRTALIDAMVPTDLKR